MQLQDTFNIELVADKNADNYTRQVWNAHFSYVTPKSPTAPKLLHRSPELANTLGLEGLSEDDFLAYFSGARTPDEGRPYSMAYGGHQFGSWAGQLGDGRAINIGEIVSEGQRWALQLKGAGMTPYSRSADGLAVLRSSIREHLCSEAMFHLGVPTTRSLSLVLTGDKVLRDILYDGHPDYEPGAVVCRVAPSFIRFGNFELFASRRDHERLRDLADYTLRHFYPALGEGNYVGLHEAVCKRTLEMVLHWQRVGFVHGVMNTDNMSILGLTIDYGPYGWLEGYEPDWTPNTTDKQTRRYRFGYQPDIALWNLYQLANALFPLVEQSAPFEKTLKQYRDDYAVGYHQMMASKLGLESTEVPKSFIDELVRNLQLTETDMTIFFRLLATVDSVDDPLKHLKEAFYEADALDGIVRDNWWSWINDYKDLIQQAAVSDRTKSMNRVNPKYVLRNYMAQLAIDAATKGDTSVLEELYTLLLDPYGEQPGMEKWFARRPEWARHKVGCSMLSCSS